MQKMIPTETVREWCIFKMQGVEASERRMEGICVFRSGDHLPGSGACMGSRSDKTVFHNWKKRQHPESTFSMTIRLILPEKKRNRSMEC